MLEERIERIQAIELHSNDILVITVDIGKMRPAQAEAYMLKVKEMVKSVLGDVKMLVTANNIDLTVLHILEDA